jgi:hypothetical protein
MVHMWSGYVEILEHTAMGRRVVGGGRKASTCERNCTEAFEALM